MPKCIIFAAFAGFMLVIWVVALGSYLSVINGARDIANVTDPEKPGEFKLVFPVGLLTCDIPVQNDPTKIKNGG